MVWDHDMTYGMVWMAYNMTAGPLVGGSISMRIQWAGPKGRMQ